MRHKRMMAFLAAGATLACAPLSGSAWAAMPTDKPFSMRGVELGITLEAFKASAIPTDQGETQTQTWCSDQKLPSGIMLIQSVMNTGGGISCEWFSKNPASMLGVSNHWVSIGEGGGIPSFQFVESDGEWRLARISFYANAMYAAPIDDALTRGYGAGKSLVEPFQTRAGATYDNLIHSWDNGLSTITLKHHCLQLDRYCLTYQHTALAKILDAADDQRRTDAAGKI